MLHQRSTSNTLLRVDTSRRRTLRNLRAKVRALLPAEFFTNQQQKSKVMLRSECKVQAKMIGIKDQEILAKSRSKNKIFVKLNKKEIEHINENKQYFLCNEASIHCYDMFLRENYPELVEKEWKSPQIKKDIYYPATFLPDNLLKHDQQAKRNSLSRENMTVKRASWSRSNLQRYSELQIAEEKKQPSTAKSRQKHVINRKMAIEQQLAATRQINSTLLHRQISSALSRRQQLKASKVKSIIRPFPYSGHKDLQEDFDKFATYDIASITQKLRKICLINKSICKK